MNTNPHLKGNLIRLSALVAAVVVAASALVYSFSGESKKEGELVEVVKVLINNQEKSLEKREVLIHENADLRVEVADVKTEMVKKEKAMMEAERDRLFAEKIRLELEAQALREWKERNEPVYANLETQQNVDTLF